MRENLRAARKAAGMTQKQVAEKIGVCLRYYKAIEAGERLGSVEMWDKLEDLFAINQRALRWIRVQVKNPS